MKVLTMILAGGKGERLYPLTRDRAKPAVPFGGIYRIIDFTLTNCVYSDLKQILRLTQYRSFSLEKHIQRGWNILCDKLGEFIHIVSAQQRVDEIWYQGTADAVYQNLYTLQKIRPDLVLILSGDHLYKMDYRNLIRFHLEKNADLTVSTIPQPKELSRHFGVMEIDEEHRIRAFQEKPQTAQPLPTDPETILASMGIYVFRTEVMVRRLIEDAKTDSQHDFGKNIIPNMVDRDRVYAYIFRDGKTGRPFYWRDVGTIQAYWEAHQDLLGPEPSFDLYDPEWPILTYKPPAPPARVIGEWNHDGRGTIFNSMLSSGCILNGLRIANSILSPNVLVEEDAEVEDSILFEGVMVKKGAKLRRAIVDKRTIIPEGMIIGHDLEQDKKTFTVTDTGIVVVTEESTLT